MGLQNKKVPIVLGAILSRKKWFLHGRESRYLFKMDFRLGQGLVDGDPGGWYKGESHSGMRFLDNHEKEIDMFDADVFKNRLARQLADFGLVCTAAWELAPNVFTAQLRYPDDDEWTFVLYRDLTETGRRNPRLINRALGLLMVGGVTHGVLSEDVGESVGVTHFSGNVLADKFIGNPGSALNVATQLFVGENGDELAWFDCPKRMDISRITATPG